MHQRNTAPRTAALEMALLRGIAAAAGLDAADRQKPILVIEELRSHDWASATCEGALHSFDLRLQGSASAVGAAWAQLSQCLPEWEFTISGHIVADVELPRALEDGAATDAPAPEAVAGDAPAQPPIIDALGPGPSPGTFTASRSFTVNILTIID